MILAVDEVGVTHLQKCINQGKQFSPLACALQVYHDSEEGRQYMRFYDIKEWPYVAVIDPITGIFTKQF